MPDEKDIPVLGYAPAPPRPLHPTLLTALAPTLVATVILASVLGILARNGARGQSQAITGVGIRPFHLSWPSTLASIDPADSSEYESSPATTVGQTLEQEQ